MTMYDELVKRLRVCPNYTEACVSCPHEHDLGCRTTTMHEAADAIEELSKYADTIRRLKCEGWYLQQTKFHDGYHAVSTMPLPEPPKEE